MLLASVSLFLLLCIGIRALIPTPFEVVKILNSEETKIVAQNLAINPLNEAEVITWDS